MSDLEIVEVPGTGQVSSSDTLLRAPAESGVTLDDVARAAGVSTATVSRVINNFPRVAPKTRERVREIIERLEYTPNFAGRSLATRRTRTIGLIIADITNPFYPEIVRGVEEAALRRDLNVLLYDTAEDTSREAQALQLLTERQVEGVVICASRLSETLLERFERGQTPIVFINRYPSSRASAMTTDHEQGVALAVEHLAALGHRRVGYLGGPTTSQVQQRRTAAFVERCEALGLHTWIDNDAPTVQGGLDGTLRALQGQPAQQRPTGLLVYNDLMAVGTMLAASAAGLSVPADLSVIGHDDIPMAALLTPALTTVRQSAHQLGEGAVELLADRIQGASRGRALPAETITLAPELMVRASTAACRTEE